MSIEGTATTLAGDKIKFVVVTGCPPYGPRIWFYEVRNSDYDNLRMAFDNLSVWGGIDKSVHAPQLKYADRKPGEPEPVFFRELSWEFSSTLEPWLSDRIGLEAFISKALKPQHTFQKIAEAFVKARNYDDLMQARIEAAKPRPENDEWKKLADLGQRIEAVKMARNKLGLSLGEARDVVESYLRKGSDGGAGDENYALKA